MLAIAFPEFDPVALDLWIVVIRWYSLAYMAGLGLGLWWCIRLSRGTVGRPTSDDLMDFLFWAGVGVMAGGRLGFVLFYNPGYYVANPLDILKVWQGGMSFHGGLLGVVVATVWYARSQGINPFRLGDLVACAAPIGLFFGRIANFVNGELWGRPTDVPWAVIFPDPYAGGLPRHPSQLYEAVLEGLVLFVLLAWLAAKPAVRARTGTLSGVFLVGYAIGRGVAETFREPNIEIGYLAFGLTMGQLLCLPMLVVGIVILVRAPIGRVEPARA